MDHYPTLSEQGEKEAQELIDKFKENMKKVADEILGELYCDVIVHISSDSWCNYRNKFMDGIKYYKKSDLYSEYDYKDLRQAIYKENKEEIVKDLNSDNLERIKSLENQLRELREIIRY